MSTLRNLLLWLSAVDRDVLERCPRETTRFVTAGGAVALTTAMAAISGAYAASSLIHLGAFASLAAGAGWALGIMNLERYVQSSIRRQRTTALTLLQALPRLGLAVALGLVISKPLLLRIFQNEVRAQVAVDKNAQRAAARDALKGQFATVPTLQATARGLERELSTPPAIGTVLGKSPEYHALAKRYGVFREQARNASSPHTAAAYEHAASEALRQMGPLRQELLAREAADHRTRESNQQKQLRATRAELAPLQRELNARSEELTHRYEAPSGLADQDKALSVLESKNSVVGTEAKVLWLFIIAVDMLPALMKLLMSIGRSTPYEDNQDRLDKSAVAVVEARENLSVKEAERAAAEQFQVQSEVAKARSEQQIAAQKEMDEASIRTIKETIRPHVERWARATAERYATRLAEETTPEAFAARERRAHAERQEHRVDERRRSFVDEAFYRAKWMRGRRR